MTDLLFDSVELDINAIKNNEAPFIGNQVFFDDVKTPIHVEFLDSNRGVKARAQGVKSGSKFTFKNGDNIAIMAIKTPIDQQIKYILTNGDVEFNRLSGQISASIEQGNFIGDTTKLLLSSTDAMQVMPPSNLIKRIIFTADKTKK